MAVEQRWSKTGCESSGNWKNAGGRFRGGSTAGDFERELASYGSRSSSEPRKGGACALVFLIILATAAAIATSASLCLDNFVGASEPGRAFDLPYPRLEDKFMSRVIFNDSIPNAGVSFHKYVDLRQSVDGTTVTVRKGVLSQCDKPLAAPAVVRYAESPWSERTCTPDGIRTFFCPVVVVRNVGGLPEVIGGSAGSDGCFTREQRCNGVLDCPSGHDEMGCTAEGTPSCPTGASPCPDKNICVKDSQLCDGFNDCGMYEDESNCCGVDGFTRCNDGRCVPGNRCDGQAECIDLSDEYNCPVPSDDAYFQCDDGQLIEGRHVCDAGSGTLQPYQCRDLSDETDCSNPSRFTHRRASSSSFATFDRGAGCFVSSNFRDNDHPSAAGGRRSSAAAGTGYESAIVAILAAFVASLTCSWVACLLAWLSCTSSLRRRRPVASARLHLLGAGLLFLCAAAQCAVVVYWCLYAGDVNRELHNAKQPSMLGQVFRETLLALGIELRLRTSLVLTAIAAALHLICVVLSLVARQSRLRQLDSAMASFVTESDAASGHSSTRNEKKNKQKAVPPLSISTAYHGSSLSDGVGEATPTLCIRSLHRLDVKCPSAAGGENDCDEQRSLPEKESLDSSQWMDVDKEKLRAILDDGDAANAAAAAADCDEQEAVPLLPPPSACVGRQFFDVSEAAASDVTAGSSSQSGPPPLLLQRLSKSRAVVLPCVQESECEMAEDQYVNVARRPDGFDGTHCCHGDTSSAGHAHCENAIEPGDAVATPPPEVGVHWGDNGSRLSICSGEVEVGGAIGRHLPGCASSVEASTAIGSSAAEVVVTGSPSEAGSDPPDNDGGRSDSGSALTCHGRPAACSTAEKPRAGEGGRHGVDTSTAAAGAQLSGSPRREPLTGTPKSSCSAAQQLAASVGSSSDNAADESDGDSCRTSIKVTNVLDKTKESLSAFAAPRSGHLARAGR